MLLFTDGCTTYPRAAAPEDLREWIRRVAIGDDVDVVEEEAEIAMTLVERLDAWQANDSDLSSFCSSLDELRSAVESNDVVISLVPIVEGRNRLINIIAKHGDGVLTRTQFESFLSETGWHKSVRCRILDLSDGALDRLRLSLNIEDYGTLARLVA